MQFEFSYDAVVLLIGVLFSFVVSQSVKVLLLGFKKKRWHWSLVYQDGGFPSSHTAIVSALCTGVYLFSGFSLLFIICLVLLFVVMRDAIGVRHQVGQLTHRVAVHSPDISPYAGHTFDESMGGLAIGILVTLLVFSIFI